MTDETTKRAARTAQTGKKAGSARGRALDRLPRAAQDLDREDAAIHREGVGDQKPGVKPVRDSSRARTSPSKS